jgi:protein-disulfide isomerase
MADNKLRPPPPTPGSPAYDEWRLDESLEETFPASDSTLTSRPGSSLSLKYRAEADAAPRGTAGASCLQGSPRSPAGPQLARPVDPKRDHVHGPAHATLTLVEYADFECPSCKLAAPALLLLVERFRPHVCLVFRHFPLVQYHPHAEAAAEAAEAAGTQGMFWRMHDLLFQGALHLSRQTFVGYAGQLGLDLERFTRELDSHIHLPRVADDVESGRQSSIRTTPGVFLDGELVDMSFGPERLYQAVESKLH